MATDYKKIAEKHQVGYGSFKEYRSFFYEQLYNAKTHFVYELIQNADDNESNHLELQLGENSLLVWNDGYQFSEEDVRSICSLGLSNKDLTRIGTFGIGFKSVYNYTDLPEIYSGDERFLIRHLTEPEYIENLDPKIAALVKMGKTVFHLPFKGDESREDNIIGLKKWLCNLADKRTLLFLRNLSIVQWSDECDRQIGRYTCNRERHTQMQNAYRVELAVSVNGKNKQSETFLVFRKDILPQPEVLKELNRKTKSVKEQQRIQESGKKKQPIEVAFKLEDGRITEIKDCVLFAYLPTGIRTDLRFIIQARYQTTLARKDIQMDSPWNRWLVQETANFLPEILEQLKISGLLKPTFFNVLPLKGDVENEFKPIAEVLQKAMRERAFVPTEKEGNYAKAENVLYPHDKLLRQLFDSNWLFPNSSWLHPKIQDKEESRRRFTVMQEAGVETVEITDILSWLEKQDVEWFEGRCHEWLLTLYTYLKKHQSRLERIKKLPLIRLENEEQVCAKDGLAFFPPDSDEEREEIAPFLKELPILMSVLLEGENSYEIEAFLKKLGVRTLNPEDIINESICPKYLQSEKPSVAQNRLHVRYLFKVWDKISDTEIKKKISETPILRAYKGFQQENSDFVLPYDAYLSQTYTGNTDLENYFSVYNGEIWFVDHAYLENDSNRKDWLKFLKTIGVMETPQIIKDSISVDYQNCQELDKRGLKYETDSSNYEHTIKDFYLQSLSEVLTKISESRKVNLSKALWCLLIKALPSRKYDRDNFFKGTYNWFYYKDKCRSFDSIFYCELKKNAWLPDEQGNLHRPSECFAPTSENKKVLGDSVAYLHPDFDISQDNEPARWLAEKLGINLNANTDSVMNYLKTLSGSTTNIKDIVPLYRYLDDYGARRQEEFKAESLIFTPEPEPSWWQADKVFWEDESAVFGNDRGYLKEYYPDNLKSFFSASGVSERAAPLDYVRGIQDVTSTKNVGEEEVRNRVRILYSRLWGHLQEEGSFLEDEAWQEEWEETREGKCWLGKKGNEWGFFFSHELVWNDHGYFAKIFEGEVPFWGCSNDLSELAKALSIEGCSHAETITKPSRFQETDHDWSEKVRNLHPFVHAFLKSPGLGNKKDTEPAKVITRLSVCRVEELEVTYKLKGIPADPKPLPSLLDENAQGAILWVKSTVEESEYAEPISDALQEHFDVKDLGGFAEDLLTKDRDNVLSRWERKGLQTDLCVLPQEICPDNEQLPEPIDEKIPPEIDSEHDVPEMIEPKVETPIPHEVPQTNSRDENSENDETETPTYSQSTNWTSQSGGHRRNTSNRRRGRGGRGGFGGGGEGEKHQYLKDYLADNPSLFGEKLELVKKEYRFKSGDESDILLEDSSGKPVTVEVKPLISSGSDQEAWQAVKYKHLAAVEYSLPCEQVRSILAAPIIPDDVKEKCKELGIEPIEVPDLL